MQKTITDFYNYNPIERGIINKEKRIIINNIYLLNKEMDDLRDRKFKLVKKLELLNKTKSQLGSIRE